VHVMTHRLAGEFVQNEGMDGCTPTWRLWPPTSKEGTHDVVSSDLPVQGIHMVNQHAAPNLIGVSNLALVTIVNTGAWCPKGRASVSDQAALHSLVEGAASR
jgi:hypothetical protein